MANDTPIAKDLEWPVEISNESGWVSTDGAWATRRRFEARVHFVGGELRQASGIAEMRRLAREGRFVGRGGITGNGGLLVSVEIELTSSGAPTCRRLELAPEPPSREAISVTATRIPLLKVMKRAAAEATVRLSEPDGQGRQVAIWGEGEPVDNFVAEHSAGRRPPRRGAVLTDADLRRVARIYLAAQDDIRRRHAPRQAVADAEGVSIRTASRRIELARQRGLLDA